MSVDDWISEYGDMVLSLCLKVLKDRDLAMDAHCRCGLEEQLKMTTFKSDIASIKNIAEKAKLLHDLGKPLPPMEYWEKIRDSCHKRDTVAL